MVSCFIIKFSIQERTERRRRNLDYKKESFKLFKTIIHFIPTFNVELNLKVELYPAAINER